MADEPTKKLMTAMSRQTKFLASIKRLAEELAVKKRKKEEAAKVTANTAPTSNT
jgi:hypothetical protein